MLHLTNVKFVLNPRFFVHNQYYVYKFAPDKQIYSLIICIMSYERAFVNFGYKTFGDCGYYTAYLCFVDSSGIVRRLNFDDEPVSDFSPLQYISKVKDTIKQYHLETSGGYYFTNEFVNLMLNCYPLD